MTEMALVLPLLLLLLLGIVETGRIFHSYLVVTEVARDAVRYVSIGATDSEVDAAIEAGIGTLDSTRLTYTITPMPSQRRPGQPVTVRVEYPVELITPVLSSLLPNPLVVESAVTMRKE